MAELNRRTLKPLAGAKKQFRALSFKLFHDSPPAGSFPPGFPCIRTPCGTRRAMTIGISEEIPTGLTGPVLRNLADTAAAFYEPLWQVTPPQAHSRMLLVTDTLEFSQLLLQNPPLSKGNSLRRELSTTSAVHLKDCNHQVSLDSPSPPCKH